MLFISEITNHKLPNQIWIELDIVPQNNEIIKTFLNYSFPDSVDLFHFNCFGPMIKGEEYIMPITKALSAVNNYAGVYFLELNNDGITSFLAGSKHIKETVVFSY
mmetsp:Transcript_31432/g.27792  ORF Transcript_31432/g.27792 Transcript_31432/m.27792 type:complete len:105 (+) Transcript_31432:801-1115(+)